MLDTARRGVDVCDDELAAFVELATDVVAVAAAVVVAVVGSTVLSCDCGCPSLDSEGRRLPLVIIAGGAVEGLLLLLLPVREYSYSSLRPWSLLRMISSSSSSSPSPSLPPPLLFRPPSSPPTPRYDDDDDDDAAVGAPASVPAPAPAFVPAPRSVSAEALELMMLLCGTRTRRLGRVR